MQKTEIKGVYKVQEGILVNKDNESLMNYKARRQAQIEKENKINTLEKKVDALSDSITNVENLLKKLLKE